MEGYFGNRGTNMLEIEEGFVEIDDGTGGLRVA